jgi:IclR family pca regulon transcriptional regulator
VLLAALSDDELDAYLADRTFRPLTSKTITDAAGLREEIQRVRVQGWCLLDQELEEGVRSIAFPLHDADQKVVAAANASAHGARVGLDEMRERYVPALRECAAQIDRDLAGARY